MPSSEHAISLAFPALSGMQFLLSCLLLLFLCNSFSWLGVSSLMSSLSLFRLFLLVTRSEVALSFRLSAVCRGSIFLLHGFLLPLGYSSISLMSLLLTSVWRFPISTSFSVACRLRSVSAPTLPGVYSSVPMRCSFLPCYFGWSAILPSPLFPWVSMVHLPLPIPLVHHFPFYSFGALLPRSNLRFPPRRGPPFGPSQFPIGVLALFTCCLSFAYPSGSLLRSPPVTRLPWFRLGSF